MLPARNSVYPPVHQPSEGVADWDSFEEEEEAETAVESKTGGRLPPWRKSLGGRGGVESAKGGGSWSRHMGRRNWKAKRRDEHS